MEIHLLELERNNFYQNYFTILEYKNMFWYITINIMRGIKIKTYLTIYLKAVKSLYIFHCRYAERNLMHFLLDLENYDLNYMCHF